MKYKTLKMCLCENNIGSSFEKVTISYSEDASDLFSLTQICVIFLSKIFMLF